MLIKKFGLLAVFVISLHANAKEIDVEKIRLSDEAGAVVEQIATTFTEKTVLLVVDAKQIASQKALSKLQQSKLDWRNRLVIVVIGSGNDLKATISSRPLVGVRWFSTPIGLAPKAFKVAGAPFAVGVLPGGVTGWRVIGEAAISDNDLSKLKTWVSLPATVP
jgi:hypothetical protein